MSTTRTSATRLQTLLMLLLAAFACNSATGVQAQQPRVEAIYGEPFGVGRITLPIQTKVDGERLTTHLMSVTNSESRVLYPAIRYTQPLGVMREIFGIEAGEGPSQLQIHFLFKGTTPFDLDITLPKPQTISVTPGNRRIAYQRLLRAWWLRYKSAVRRQRQEGDYTPVLETYLTSMLARRMKLTKLARSQFDNEGQAISLLLGTEKLRLSMLGDAVEGLVSRNQPLSQPLPAPIQWAEEAHRQIDADVQIEPIAHRIPHECFYIRFAQFPNYLWLRRLLEEYGGDLSRMVMLRGTDPQLNQRVENQLGLRESNLSRILGPQVISDVAMLGRDTYLGEGAAIGILFEAKNDLLRNELLNQRKQRVQQLRAAGAVEATIEIEGQAVSFASTKDHRLRSFYVQSGKYHLVTNCREIAKRFLQCEKGIDTLGDSAEFRYARTLIPQGKENTLFVYLSRRFFEGLLSPQYQIELPRRLRSLTDMQATDLAELAAMAEGYPQTSITMNQLVDLGFLPSPTDVRNDGSRNEPGASAIVDSVRGAPGTFLPIPDVEIGNITEQEALAYHRIAEFHQERWKQMDPVLIGLRRTALDGQTERVEVQASMLPLNREKYGVFTEIFGPPTHKRIAPLADDIVSIQAYVDGGGWELQPHHLYFGIRDLAPIGDISQRRVLQFLQVIRTAPAYLAAWPRPGVLDSLGLQGEATADGYEQLLLGLTRLNADRNYSFLSFDKNILTDVADQLHVETVEKPAQVHVKFGDIKNSKFGKWADDLDFQRAFETSVGNVHLMHLLTQQLHVPPKEAQAVAERILNAALACPLRGEYKTFENPDGTQRWSSTAWVDGKAASRERYVSPLMTWLRGLELAVTIEDDRIVAEGTLDIEREKQEGIKLPSFNFFGTRKPAEESSPNN